MERDCIFMKHCKVAESLPKHATAFSLFITTKMHRFPPIVFSIDFTPQKDPYSEVFSRQRKLGVRFLRALNVANFRIFVNSRRG